MKSFVGIIILFLSFTAYGQQPLYPRYNQVYRMATHNSYWVKRAKTHEAFASGTQERLLDQLLFDHARALEIDIHKTRGKNGQWQVYHTGNRKNVLFKDFADFLKQVQQFQYALPKHEVLTVVIELKEILAHNFDKNHTPAQFDSLLETYLGQSLFRPRDLMKRCDGAANLRECVKSNPDIWPTTEELRGKVIFLVLGNFHFSPIGHGGEGWATYGACDNPSAFPMSTDFSRFNNGITSEKVPADKLQKAYNASVFQQVEVLEDSAHIEDVKQFIKQGGIVRGKDSYTLEEQQKRIALGFHMLQTDYPWIYYGDKGCNSPFCALDTVKYNQPSFFEEPGNRIFLSADSFVFKTINVSDAVSNWETLPSTTIPSPVAAYANLKLPYGKGCLYARADAQNSISVCRQVNRKQNVVISVVVKQNGNTTQQTFTTNNNTVGTVGDCIRMKIDRTEGGCYVRIFSSPKMSLVKGEWVPEWNLLGVYPFLVYLNIQGISANEGDVLFVGTKRNGQPAW